jgi:hypothetical protein
MLAQKGQACRQAGGLGFKGSSMAIDSFTWSSTRETPEPLSKEKGE